MKKISKLLMMAVVALGVSFTACNNDNLPDGPDVDAKANTHVSVTLKMSQGLKAAAEDLPNDYNYIGEWAGQDVIKTIDIYLVSGSTVDHRSYTVGTSEGDHYEAAVSGLDIIIKPKLGAAIKTTVGMKEVYAVVNISAEATTALNNVSNATAFKTAYESVLTLDNEGSASVHKTSASKLAIVNSDSKDEIMMTVLNPGSINVEAGVKADETIADTPKNRASVVVERTTSRVMMTRADKTEFEVKDPEYQLIGKITNVKWVAAQGNKQINIQRKADWVTPGHDFVPVTNSAGSLTTANSAQYDYSGLFEGYAAAPSYGGTDVATYADYANTPADNNNATEIVKNSLQGKFILPVTHKYAKAPEGDAAYDGDYKKGNTSYVMVRTTFTPEVIYSVKGETGDDRFENVAGSYTEHSDFIVGSDGRFYASEQAAYNATKNLKMTKYTGGKVLYYAWLNPDVVEAPYNSPSLRNNIYHIHITGFKNLGTNWNTLFPEDPDTVTPDDGGNPDPKPEYDKVIDPENPDKELEPEEPNPPIDPDDPLTTKETYMSVDVKVLPWKVHSYKVDLGI